MFIEHTFWSAHLGHMFWSAAMWTGLSFLSGFCHDFFRYLLQVSFVTSDRVILDPAGATAVALDSSCSTAMLAAGYGPGVILSRRHKRFFGQVRLLCQVHLGSESSVSSLACWGRTLWALSVELIQFGNSIKWIFHYKTSILGYLPVWNPPNDVI